MSPVVLRNTTALYCARLESVKIEASSVASTSKPFCCPSCRMAAMPSGIESWRKPVVFEKMRILVCDCTAIFGEEKSAQATSSAVKNTIMQLFDLMAIDLKCDGSAGESCATSTYCLILESKRNG